MIRSFGLQTLTGSAQPLFADKLTAAMVVPPVNIDPIMTVADTTKYQGGDRITIEPFTSLVDTVLVETILSATTMQVSSQGAPLHAHAANALIELDMPCAEILINPVTGNSGTTWIGTDNTVTSSGGGSAFVALPGGTSLNLGFPQWNAIRTSEAWMAGTLNDKVGVAAVIV